ncbi:MAG: YajG family lipoprotein [Pseudomonadota bacterium]
MKRITIVALLAIIASSSGIASAAESVSIALTMPPGTAAEACKIPAWKGLTVAWGGVTDKRPSPEVGLQTQKGKEAIPVLAEPALTSAFDSALRTLFSACGMKFASKETEGAVQLSAEIREFYVGVKKGLLTGKSEAKSGIAFVSRHGNQSATVVVGSEMESKKIRSGNIKQITSTLNDLFADTLKQIPATQEMRELK